MSSEAGHTQGAAKQPFQKSREPFGNAKVHGLNARRLYRVALRPYRNLVGMKIVKPKLIQ
jgi:hypothetical protein